MLFFKQALYIYITITSYYFHTIQSIYGSNSFECLFRKTKVGPKWVLKCLFGVFIKIQAKKEKNWNARS